MYYESIILITKRTKKNPPKKYKTENIKGRVSATNIMTKMVPFRAY